MRSAKICATNHLQHQLLVSIEKMPPPYRFAWRNILFGNLPGVFVQSLAYQKWKEAYTYFIDNRPTSIQIIDLEKIAKPKIAPSKKIAIHAHIFYLDLVPQLVALLAKFPLPFDLLISAVDATQEELLLSQFQGLPQLKTLQIRITPNRGRDLGPMLNTYGKDLLQYDCIAHVHTKKSVGTNTIGNRWRDYLWEGLLSHEQERIPKLIELLSTYGLIMQGLMIYATNSQSPSRLRVILNFLQVRCFGPILRLSNLYLTILLLPKILRKNRVKAMARSCTRLSAA